MWATNPHLDQAIELGKAWGFAWATVAFVWDKVRVNPGFYTMSQCELCLVFKRGKIPSPRGARNIRQLVTAKREAHSQKPDEVRRVSRRCFRFSERSNCLRAREMAKSFPMVIGRNGDSKRMAWKHLEWRESWQAEAAERGGKPEEVFDLIMLHYLIELPIAGIKNPRELRGIYGDGYGYHGIAPDLVYVIRIPTGACMSKSSGNGQRKTLKSGPVSS